MLNNKATLESKLTNIISNYETGSATPGDVISAALSIRTFNPNDINLLTVSSVASLPNLKLYQSPYAILCFITSINTFAISTSDYRWLSLDGRLIRADTTVNRLFSWGVNLDGNVGDNTVVDRSSPVQVIGNIGWVIAHCQAAIKNDGSLWVWGLGSSGQLGNNDLTTRSSPVTVIGGFTDWCQVSRRAQVSGAVRSNGTLWMWGSGYCGLLGQGTSCYINRSSPITVAGGFTDWRQVTVGTTSAFGLRSNGTIWGWGRTVCGQIGDNAFSSSFTNAPTPRQVAGGFTDWCQVSTFSGTTGAVRTNGTLWTWGCNFFGEIGDGTTGPSNSRSSPVSVIGGFTDWCQVSAGNEFMLGLRTNGTLWGWGYGRFGVLGNGISGGQAVSARSSPVSVVGGFTDWCFVQAGCWNVAAIRANGTRWTWGCNRCGSLGTGDTVYRSSPVSVVGGFTDWLSTGGSTTGIRGITC